MLTINLPPELEDQVRQNAAAQGSDMDTYVHSLILQALRQPVPPIIPAKTSLDDFLAHLYAMGRYVDPSVTPLPDEATRRENMYADEGIP